MNNENVDKDEFALYENGKQHRYNLLFAVNGGGFAIATFLADKSKNIGGLSIMELSIGTVLFTLVMTYNIVQFGLNCRERNLNKKIFERSGVIVLSLLCVLICAGWLIVGFINPTPCK